MEKTGLKTKFEIFETAIYKVLNIILSVTAGFLISKAEIKSLFSPFSLSLLAISPTAKLSVISVYIGSVLGFITNEFSILNFKYICANTIMLATILITGKKSYTRNVYTPILPGIICFISGIIFMLADEFGLYSFLLLLCESLLCSCASYFAKYFLDAASSKTKLDTKDIISFNITLLITLCALDNYYIFGFSVSLIFLIFLIYLCNYYFDRKTAALFSLPICLVMTILHSGYEYFLLILYIPALISIAVSKFDKKYIVPSYYLPYLSISTFTTSFGFNVAIILSPLVSAVFYYLMPKTKIANFLSKYINIYEPTYEKSIADRNELCDKYCENANLLVKQISFTEVSPILDTSIENKLKRFMFTNGCRDISISNFYNSSGKQIVSISFKNGEKISSHTVRDKLSSLSGQNFITSYEENGVYKFEHANRYKVECHGLYKAKHGEAVCGDSLCAFKTIGSNYVLILADGMGSGKEAYVKSNDTVNILKKLLRSGITPAKAIETVNSSISIIKDEIGFSTIDLCNISLNNGKVEFYKCGAYTSFILRKNKLIKIDAGGFPAGLSDKISYTQNTIELYDRDTIIMLSDGVSNAIDKIQATILLNEHECIENTARELIDCAYKNTPFEYDDDMTVVVAKISERKFE